MKFTFIWMANNYLKYRIPIYSEVIINSNRAYTMHEESKAKQFIDPHTLAQSCSERLSNNRNNSSFVDCCSEDEHIVDQINDNKSFNVDKVNAIVIFKLSILI